MIYAYECRWGCGTQDVIKPVWRYAFDERCEKCGAFLQKKICAPQVSVGTFLSGYYHAFGKTFTNEHQLKNAIRRHEGETGKKVIEVGNEHSAMKKIRPSKKKSDIEGAMRLMKTHKVNFNA